MTQKANMMEQFLDDVPHAPIKHGAVLLKRTRTHNHNQTPFGAREFWMGDDALYCSKIGSTKALECIRLDDVHSVSEPQCIGARELQPLHFLDTSGTGTNNQDHGRASHHAAGQDKDKLSHTPTVRMRRGRTATARLRAAFGSRSCTPWTLLRRSRAATLEV